MSPARKTKKIAFVASQSPEATEARARLVARYGDCEPPKPPTSWLHSAATD